MLYEKYENVLKTNTAYVKYYFEIFFVYLCKRVISSTYIIFNRKYVIVNLNNIRQFEHISKLFTELRAFTKINWSYKHFSTIKLKNLIEFNLVENLIKFNLVENLI